MNEFKLVAPYTPQGDQPQAIQELVEGLNKGVKEQTLLGATGTGKTFTIANVIKEVNKPTLVLAHNKTLAGQLYGELKEFFPENAVEYFVSYYDYYQPEAYVPSSDTYIEKESSVNDEIDKLRHSATSALLERRDVIVVASVSSMYGLVNPEDYRDHVLSLREGMEIERDELLRRLVEMQFERNDYDFRRGTFRVRGDVVEIFLAGHDATAFRIEFFGDEIEAIKEVDVLTGEIKWRTIVRLKHQKSYCICRVLVQNFLECVEVAQRLGHLLTVNAKHSGVHPIIGEKVVQVGTVSAAP